jgi:hypothetical protein
LDWAVYGRPISDADISGDDYAVAAFAGGVTIAVIDGLGHGVEAASAAEMAAAVIRQNAAAPVDTIMAACHEALRGSHGAVVSIASINANEGQLSWVGIGNVEAVLFCGRERTHIVPRAGVLGLRISALRPVTLKISPGDFLMFASDGLDSDCIDARLTEPLLECAAHLVEVYGKSHDDALALLAKYRGLSA